MKFRFLTGVTKSLALLIFGLGLIGCSAKEGAFSDPPQGATSTDIDRIAILSGDINTRSVAIYQIDGTFDQFIFDYRTDLGTPRGVCLLDESNLAIALDNTDRISRLTWRGEEKGAEELFANTGLGGAIYQIRSNSLGEIFVLEATTGVERYDQDGVRVGAPYIATTVGSCTLNNPRGAFITADNKLIVTNQGGTDDVLVYDISGLTPTCLSSTNFGNGPYGVILHSDGYLYIVTQDDDRVYRANPDGSNATMIWDTDLTRINNPTAIIELPNGNLAIASSVTDEVWEMTTAGVLPSSSPFIRDPLSLNITDMVLIPAVVDE